MRSQSAPAPAPDLSTPEYLQHLGAVFKACRGKRAVTDIARAMKGRVSRATIDRLERGAPDVGLRSVIELAHFYSLTLSTLNRRALDLVAPPHEEFGGTLTLTLSREERDLVLSALLTTRRREPPT